MITIFTIPKAFKGHEAIIQKNAIKNWIKLEPKCQIFLFGNDHGVNDVAQELNLKHFPDIARNKFGTPLLGDAFKITQKNAIHSIIMYVNADILFFSDLIQTVKSIKLNKYLLCGRRWDLDINKNINFEDKNWESELQNKVASDGQLHGYSGIDYFIFKKDLFILPDFAVGRGGWDNWVLFNARERDISIIDCTESIKVIHQNHDYNHLSVKPENRRKLEEVKINFALAGGKNNQLTLRESDYLLINMNLVNPGWPNNFLRFLSKFLLWRMFLSFKRDLFQ
jgi:hypothetical protein